MKTKEQILEHCKNVGHTETARRQIWAYLIGKGIKDKEEEILLKDGESTFDDFLKWENKNNEVNENKDIKQINNVENKQIEKDEISAEDGILPASNNMTNTWFYYDIWKSKFETRRSYYMGTRF